eukprot:scaffold132483_cov69-Phaeocystis_antarctica.AAC.3
MTGASSGQSATPPAGRNQLRVRFGKFAVRGAERSSDALSSGDAAAASVTSMKGASLGTKSGPSFRAEQ